MNSNRLKDLEKFGQSIWLDYMRRDLIVGGKLRRLIEEEGLRGMTSNPAIFEKAISKGHDYDEQIRTLAMQGASVETIYEKLIQKDVQSAADEFRHVYDETDGRDGYVSLELNPHLAHDTNGMLAEARQFWDALDRPNVFIKVPATAAGLPVIQQLISEGINVNVTLLFGLPRYRQVVEAYIAGIETRAAAGGSLERVASVASFFVSRIDTLVDPLLEKVVPRGGRNASVARKLRGQVAIASAKAAYQVFKETFKHERFRKLADRGARVQRLLWASTSVKNPEYSDLKYVEALIGPDTVNTVPLETLEAYRDHGDARPQLERHLSEANAAFERLGELGIDLDKLTQRLEDEGIEKFNQSIDKLLRTLKESPTRILTAEAPRESRTKEAPARDQARTREEDAWRNEGNPN